jgi:hypothetical protein
MDTAEPDAGRHKGHTSDAVSVAELVERAAREGRALYLNWPPDAAEEDGLAAMRHGEWPTAVLPRVGDELGGLPRRRGDRDIPPPTEPVRIERDPEVLRRVRDGLRGLG